MPTTCPDAARLRHLLDETLPAAEQHALQSHVDECRDCQRALERLAAGKDSWSNAAQHLGAADSEAVQEPALQKVVAELAAQPNSAEQTGPASSAFQADDLSFLGPPTRTGSLGRLDHYEILAVVGRGAFGVVLKACDDVLDRIVAIKVLAPDLARNRTARLRFQREAKAGAAISHDHVVGIHAVNESQGVPYIVMQLVAGVSLQQRLDQSGPLELKEILRIGMQAASGLAAAHAQGLIHRDVKPANILLENGIERVKITDFGLARAIDDAAVTQSGVIAGTPMYMAPEQAAGESVDCRADVFSLGSVLYTMCTARPPFRASGTMAVLKRVIEEAPRPIKEINPDIPDWLCDIIAKLHAKVPQERFQSANEVAELLGRHLSLVQQPGWRPPRERAPRASFSARESLLGRSALHPTSERIVVAILITCLGAFTGARLADSLFAKTRTTVRDGLLRVDKAAGDEVMITGGLVGLTLGAFAALALVRAARRKDPIWVRRGVGYPLLAALVALLFILSWGDSDHGEANAPSTIVGTWASDWGQVTLLHVAVEDSKPVIVNGYYMKGGVKAHITRGTFDPVAGAFEFVFWEPEQKITGSAKLQLSPNGNRLEGTWSNSVGDSGTWTMIRVTPAPVTDPP